MYQETEKFEKYGKLFVPLVGGALLLPFVVMAIASASWEEFSLSSFLIGVIVLFFFIYGILALILGQIGRAHV